RSKYLWLATSASVGASRSVGMNDCDQRCIYARVAQPPSAVGVAIQREFLIVKEAIAEKRFAYLPVAGKGCDGVMDSASASALFFKSPAASLIDSAKASALCLRSPAASTTFFFIASVEGTCTSHARPTHLSILMK